MEIPPDSKRTTEQQRTTFNRDHVSFRGRLLEPGSADFDTARMIHNGLIDKRPAYIAQCASNNDVIVAIDMAIKLGLEISIRGGGHNVGGRAVTDGGLMIDMSTMKAITVSPSTRSATAEAGVTWGEFNEATLAHGLATTGGVISSTGVAGLTLGGGLGWLMAQHGLAVDNLLSARIITAEGEILTVDEDQHADLFWALRGGGGNFGVVTQFTFRLHPVSDVFGGLVMHPLDRAPEMLRFYRETTAAPRDDLSLFAGLLHAPDGSGNKVSAMVGFHPDATAGAEALAPVRAFGPPIVDAFTAMPYKQLNLMLDGGFPRGALNYWKSSFIESLTDEMIDTMVEAFRKCPAPMSSMLLEHFHGAVTRIPVDATAFPHRNTGYNLLIAGQWMDPTQSDECIAWVRQTYEAMTPFIATGRYVNYLGDDETSTDVAHAYGSNYSRLQQIKTKYDPGNLFRLNQNIQPALRTG